MTRRFGSMYGSNLMFVSFLLLVIMPCMPYVEPVPLDSNHLPIRSPALDKAVYSAVQQMAAAGYCHLDLHWRHVGILPSQQTSKSNNKNTQRHTSSPSIILFDLARVEETSEDEGLSRMLDALKLNV